MKKIWLLLIVIALGGCKFSEDGSKEYEQTVVNNSKYTVLCKNIEIEPNTIVKVPVAVGFNSMSADELTFSYTVQYPRVSVSKERLYKNLEWKYTISDSEFKNCVITNTSAYDICVINNYFEGEYVEEDNSDITTKNSSKKEIPKSTDTTPEPSVTTVLYNYTGTVGKSNFLVYKNISTQNNNLNYSIQTENFIVDNSSDDAIFVTIY